MFDIDTTFIKYPETEEEKENNIYYKILSKIYNRSYRIIEEYKKEEKEYEKIASHNKMIIIIWGVFMICSSIVSASWVPLAFAIIGLFVCLADVRSTNASAINYEKKLYKLVNEALQDTLRDELEKTIVFIENSDISQEEISRKLADFDLTHYHMVNKLEDTYDSMNGDLTFEKLEKGYEFNKFKFGRCNCCNKKDVPIKHSTHYDAFFCRECYEEYIYDK